MDQPTPEEAQALVDATPTRRIVYRRCLDCWREWSQPSKVGACPSCHGNRIENDGVKISTYKQV